MQNRVEIKSVVTHCSHCLAQHNQIQITSSLLSQDINTVRNSGVKEPVESIGPTALKGCCSIADAKSLVNQQALTGARTRYCSRSIPHGVNAKNRHGLRRRCH